MKECDVDTMIRYTPKDMRKDKPGTAKLKRNKLLDADKRKPFRGLTLYLRDSDPCRKHPLQQHRAECRVEKNKRVSPLYPWSIEKKLPGSNVHSKWNHGRECNSLQNNS